MIEFINKEEGKQMALNQFSRTQLLLGRESMELLADATVPAAGAVSKNGIIDLSDLPELLKLCRIGLSVRIGLKDVVRTMFKCVAVAVKNRGTVTAVLLRQNGEQRTVFTLCRRNFVRIVTAPVVDDHKTGCAIAFVPFNDGVPFFDRSFDIF